jgi:hypothetical protein
MKSSGRTRVAGVAVLALAALGAGFASVRPGGDDDRPRVGGPASDEPGRVSLADPPESALEIPAPVELSASRFESTWSPVRKTIAARSGPGARFGIVARIRPRTPEGTSNLVVVLGSEDTADGSLWVRALLPALRPGTTGWLPRSALGGYVVVRTHLIVDLSNRRATLQRNGQTVFSAPVGIGTARSPTPTGSFYVRSKLTRYRNAFYGPVAFGTSARSAVLTDWPAGGFVGIHGTSQPGLIPGRVSHGCIRLRNPAVVRLASLMPIGTPLTIRS